MDDMSTSAVVLPLFMNRLCSNNLSSIVGGLSVSDSCTLFFRSSRDSVSSKLHDADI